MDVMCFLVSIVLFIQFYLIQSHDMIHWGHLYYYEMRLHQLDK